MYIKGEYKNPISFRFRTLSKLRRLIDEITVSIEDVANASGWIDDVPVDNPAQAVNVFRIAENTAAKIIGAVPQTGASQNRIEVRTQYTGSNSILLKEPRVITSDFILEEV